MDQEETGPTLFSIRHVLVKGFKLVDVETKKQDGVDCWAVSITGV